MLQVAVQSPVARCDFDQPAMLHALSFVKIQECQQPTVHLKTQEVRTGNTRTWNNSTYLTLTHQQNTLGFAIMIMGFYNSKKPLINVDKQWRAC